MRNTIKKHDDFLVGPDDFNARCAMFFVRARPARFSNDARYGLIVTKKTFKLAVDRNRAKRMLRDWIRFNENQMCNELDYVFIARRPLLFSGRTDGRTAMKKALHYIKRTYEKSRKKK